MKANRVKGVITGLFILATLLVGIGPTTANAQGRRTAHRPGRVIVYRTYNPFFYRRYDPFWHSAYYPRYRVVDPIAYQREQGYREGQNEGEKDAKKDRPANATGHKDYLKSNSITFREAFVRGYNDGYREKLDDMRDGD
jgi:hypothetical protein